MSFNGSEGEQSEDGELRQSPQDVKKVESDFSMSEEDEEVLDESLDIKPPQAKMAQNSRLKRKEHESQRSRHKRPDKHTREDSRHLHKEKHHRDKQMRSTKDREYYQREKDKERYYREKTSYDQLMTESQQFVKERSHRERKEERASRHGESRKHEQKKEVREVHYSSSREGEKHRRRHEDDKRADRTLHDLRARLLSKRKVDDDSNSEKRHSKESHHHKRRRQADPVESAFQGESGMYVKEIISLSVGDEKHKTKKEDDLLCDKERAEQDQRREKLLEAEREMARLKEQSRLDRERRHQEKDKSTKRKEELEEHYSKRITEEITSENSEEEIEESPELIQDRESVEKDVEEEEEEEAKSDKTESTRSRSRSSERSERSRSSREKSRSTERTHSRSPESVEDRKSEERGMDNPEDQEEKPLKEIDEDLPPYYPAICGCRSVEEFQCLNRIEEGTYGVVYRARDKRTDEIVALKRLKMEKEKEGFPITSLREINTLLKGQHKNIVTVREIVVGSNMDKIFIVMDYVEHDLKSLMETMRHKKQCFTPAEVKCLLQQLLLAVAHLHDNWILHRDLKTSNLLLSHKGILKVGDFGLAREYGSPLKAYTPIVVTLWYRAPELLLCTKEYSTPIDLWSVGCIFAELTLMNALFPGKSEVDQLNRIFKELGTPNEKIWTGFNKLPAVQKMKFTEYPKSNVRSKFHALTESGIDLLMQFLTYDPMQRITAEQALKHVYFTEVPLPIDPAMFPTWPAKSELGQKRVLASPKPPSGGGEYKKLRGDGDDDYGFRIGMAQDRHRGGVGFSLKF